QVEAVNHFYGQGEARNQVLFDNSIEIGAGQLVVMTGPSGAGKTTLLTLVGALRSVQEGRVEVLGRDLSRLGPRQLVATRRHVGFIFQMHNLFAALSAYENVMMAMQLGEWRAAEMRQHGTGILDRLGLGHRIDHKPRALSGGERQRVAIARALVNEPSMILADEPTGNLDQKTGSDIIKLFEEFASSGQTIILVTHDPGIARRTPRRVKIVDGVIVDNDTLDEPGAEE
ncbi:MAG: ABC transporter ATP-binding protein, partial [Acidobacteria bacterium]|nr:ABC transporter ATP-binding protein [Acidobacteriota bacterium]